MTLDKDATGQARADYQTEQVATGPRLKVLPVWKESRWELHLTGRYTEFLGYRDAGVRQLDQAKANSFQAKEPAPLFRVREVAASSLVQTDEALLLRMPATTETVQTKKKGVFPPSRREHAHGFICWSPCTTGVKRLLKNGVALSVTSWLTAA